MENIINQLMESKYPFIILLSKNDVKDRITCSNAIFCEFYFYRFRYFSNGETAKGLIIFTKKPERTNILRSFGIAFAYKNSNSHFIFFDGKKTVLINNEDFTEVSEFPLSRLSFSKLTNDSLAEIYKMIGVDFKFKKINPTEFYLYSQYKKFHDMVIPTTIEMRFSLKGFKNTLFDHTDDIRLLKKAVSYL